MKLAILLFFSFFACSALAEDIIVMKDGDIIKSQVLEISQSEIKYKKQSNLNGPTYTINKSDVLSITYDNGEQEKFVNSSLALADKGPRYIERKTDTSRNQDLLNLYKRPHDFYEGKKESKKSTEKGTAFFAFTNNSVLSNEDIEIIFCPIVMNHFYPSGDYLKEAGDKYGTYYKIKLKNKTNRVLYVDCSNCYLTDNEGYYRTFYDNRTYTETRGGGKSGFFNLGGVSNALGIGGAIGSLANATTVGSTNMNGINITSTDERVMTIPPYGEITLPSRKYMGKSQVFERFEYFPRPYYPNIQMHKWEVQYFNEGDLPAYLKFCFTYSDSPSFNVYSTLNCELYCYEIIGQLFDYTPSDKLHNGKDFIIFKRMDHSKPLYAPIYEQVFGQPIY